MDPERNKLYVAALDSDDWTEGEKLLLRWQWQQIGGFWTSMFEALMRADDENLEHLHRAFPSVVDAVRSWKYGDLGTRLTAADLID